MINPFIIYIYPALLLSSSFSYSLLPYNPQEVGRGREGEGLGRKKEGKRGKRKETESRGGERWRGRGRGEAIGEDGARWWKMEVVVFFLLSCIGDLFGLGIFEIIVL